MAPISLYCILVMLHGLLGTLQLVGLVRKYGWGKFAKAATQITLPFAYFATAECICFMKAFLTSFRYSLFMPVSILIHVILITAAVYTVVIHNSELAFVINCNKLNANSSRRRRKKLNANCNSPRTSNPSSSESSDDSMFSNSSDDSPNSQTSAHPNNHPLLPATNAGIADTATPQRTQTVFFEGLPDCAMRVISLFLSIAETATMNVASERCQHMFYSLHNVLARRRWYTDEHCLEHDYRDSEDADPDYGDFNESDFAPDSESVEPDIETNMPVLSSPLQPIPSTFQILVHTMFSLSQGLRNFTNCYPAIHRNSEFSLVNLPSECIDMIFQCLGCAGEAALHVTNMTLHRHNHVALITVHDVRRNLDMHEDELYERMGLRSRTNMQLHMLLATTAIVLMYTFIFMISLTVATILFCSLPVKFITRKLYNMRYAILGMIIAHIAFPFWPSLGQLFLVLNTTEIQQWYGDPGPTTTVRHPPPGPSSIATIIIATATASAVITSTIIWFVLRYKYQVRQHCYMMQAGVNDWNLQAATGRIPPGWAPEKERAYSFRNWLVDIRLWQAGTDIPAERQGPLVAMRLQGAARDMIRELDPNLMAHGRQIIDHQGNVIEQNGLDYVIELLTGRFAPLEQEIQLSAIHDLFTFRRSPGDATDSVITRFEIMIHRTNVLGNIQLQPPIKTYMLLQALGIHKERWAILLAPTLGLLPVDPAEYNAFLSYLRRQGHLHEGTTHANVRANHHQQYWTTETTPVATDPTYWTSEATWSEAPAQDLMWTEEGISSSPAYYEGDTTEGWDDDDDASSGHSHASEPIDLDDIAHLPTHVAGETLYLAYRHAKRRFRHFSRSGPRRFKGKGRFRKGKGKGSSKARGKPLFYADGSPFEDEEESVFEVYYKGSGKGGKGSKHRRKNPIGKDGKLMLCSGCNADDHFVKDCKSNKGKGFSKGSDKSGKSMSKAPSSSGFYEYPTEHHQHTSAYLASALTDQSVSSSASRIVYWDGTSEAVEHVQKEGLVEASTTANTTPSTYMTFVAFVTTFKTVLTFPWWSTDWAFHAQVRLKGNDREGLLIDCGAVSNLTGDKWIARASKIASEHGQGTTITDRPAQSVEGVGSGSSIIDKQAKVPVCLANGKVGVFETAVVSNSELPALLGLDGLERNKALIDIQGKRLIYVGKGGYELHLSPGSITMQLEKVPSGHLLLPATEWNKHKSSAGTVLAHLANH